MPNKCLQPMYLYYAAHFFYGFAYYIIGPLIPFLSAYSSKPEEYFFPLIFGRGVGFLFGPFLKMFALSNFTKLHKGTFVLVLILGLNMVLTSLTYNIVILTIISFVNGGCCAVLDIFVNVSIINEGK